MMLLRYTECMKYSLFLTLVLFLAIPQVTSARWIGEMARDYSERIELNRISRENIAAQREEAQQRRFTIRVNTRTRVVPPDQELDPEANFAVRSSIRDRRLQLHMKQQGNKVHAAKTAEERSPYVQSISNARFDARRRADLGLLLDIIRQYLVNPSLPGANSIPTTRSEICRTEIPDCSGLINLNDLLVGSELQRFPLDPQVAPDAKGTGYFIQKIDGPGLRLDAPKGMGEQGVKVEWIFTQEEENG